MYTHLFGFGYHAQSRVELVFLAHGVADLASEGRLNGVGHAAGYDEDVYLREEFLDNRYLGRDLGAAEDGYKGAFGRFEHFVDGFELTLHYITEHLVVREELGYDGGRGMCAVSGAESVVDVAVGQLG